ncbi:flavin-containing monooxygenase [Microbacterium forte]|uniref:flavin-containing monooxygenase n=1 Tax=Microbacterium forte TaxID=2982533 RepID=UPI002892A720|nr:NAD(P)/FAD-dependent oxidoreductase [Microbacterium sp. A(2022)]
MTAERVEVLIVGAGFAGITAAIALRKSGRTSFLMIERAGAVGGTWRDNTYPGVACDVPSHLYCLADHPNPDWSSVYARGAEIRLYLEGLVEKQRLGDNLRLRTPMLRAEWNEDQAIWLITTDAGSIEADAIILACGRLSEPAIPEISGLPSFPGPLFHSARWDHDISLAGARVAVVGTGASGVQIVPELVGTAADIVVFQRTPAWIVPRHNRQYDLAQRKHFRGHLSELQRLRRDLASDGEARFASRSGDTAAAEAARATALQHLASQVDDGNLRRALTPDYSFGCKRVLLSDDFYPAVASETVTLEPSGLRSVHRSTLLAESGAEYEVDAVILATGFESARQPYASVVRGERGVSLEDHWSTGMTSFGSTVVDGFPNLFVLNGPNASLGHNSAVLMLEEQTGYVLRALARRRRVASGVLRVDPAAVAAYCAEIDAAAASTPWLTGGCRNWYVDPRSNRLTLLWPGTVEKFRSRLAAADGSEFLASERDAFGGDFLEVEHG